MSTAIRTAPKLVDAMPPGVPPADTLYVTGRKAHLALGISHHYLLKLVIMYGIRTLALPGLTVKYHWGDVQRVSAMLDEQRAAAAHA